MKKKTFLGDDAPMEILTKLDEFSLNGTTQDFENCATSSIACYLSTKYLPLGCNVGFNENGELFEMYNFLEQNELLDPCTGKLLDKKKLLESSCVGAVPFSIAGLYEALEGVDYITNTLGDCPKANCMLSNLINVTGSNICNVANTFYTSSDVNFGVKIGIGNLPPVNGIIPYGETTYSSGESKITLDINRICNEPSPLIISESIMHELIHALFYESMEKLGWTGSPSTMTMFFDELVHNWVSASPGSTEHEIMTEYYLEPMANTLWNLNNNLGQPSDYYGLILYGLNSTANGFNKVIANRFDLTPQDIVSAYATSLNVVVKPSTLNFTNCD